MSRAAPSTLLFAIGTLLPVAAGRAQVATIGTAHEHVAVSPSPYPRSPTPGAVVWTHRVAHPGASYLRADVVLDLAPGDVLEVLDARGATCWRYGGRGPLAGEAFLTDTVFDDAITLRLLAVRGGGGGVRVLGYEAGHPWALVGSALETACRSGSPFEDASCSTDPTERRVAEAVCALVLPGGRLCTAFFVDPDGHVLTANHCVSGRRDARRANLWLRWRERCATTVLDPTRPTVVPAPLRLLVDDRGNDVSLLLPPVNGAQIVGHLELEERDPVPGEPLFTISHAGARPQELGRGVALDRPFAQGCIGTRPATHLAHRLDTQAGSSGAPLVRAATGCVIAMHTCGGCRLGDPASANAAVRAPSFLPGLRARLPTIASCGATGTGWSRRGARLRVDERGVVRPADVPVLPGGTLRFEVARTARTEFVLTLDALGGAPRFLSAGAIVDVALPANLTPGMRALDVLDSRGAVASSLVLDVGMATPGGLPEFARWTRLAPADHEAPPASGLTREVAGDVTALRVAHEGEHRASGAFLPPGPATGAQRVSFADEWSFDLAELGVRSGRDLAALRWHAVPYARGAREGAGLEPFPAAPPTSTDAVTVHAWRFEVWDAIANAWAPLPEFVDPVAYAFGAPWRDTPYARAWSATGPAWPGPVDLAWVDPPDGVIDPLTGRLRVRLWTDVALERGARAQSVVHVFDELALDLLPRGVHARGVACEGRGGNAPGLGFRGAWVPAAAGSLRVFGAAASTVGFLFHGAPSAQRPLATLGAPACLWYVDPLLGVFALPTDANGCAELAFVLPPDASFAGFPVAWQWLQLDGGETLSLATSPVIVCRPAR